MEASVTTYTGTQAEILWANGFAFPAANASSSSAQLLCTGVTGKYQQPVYPGGFWQQGRSNQISTADFTITLSGQSSATTAIIIAGIATSPDNASGSVLVTLPAFTCTSFSSATVIGHLDISNWGSGYGTSSVATNLQTSGELAYTNATTNGTVCAGPTQLATTDFSVNQWLYLTVTFNTASTSNSATLQKFSVWGNN
jgi:hypothetical protein